MGRELKILQEHEGLEENYSIGSGGYLQDTISLLYGRKFATRAHLHETRYGGRNYFIARIEIGKDGQEYDIPAPPVFVQVKKPRSDELPHPLMYQEIAVRQIRNPKKTLLNLAKVWTEKTFMEHELEIKSFYNVHRDSDFRHF